MGRVYLIHFDRPIGNAGNPRGQASHYLGYASKSLKSRIERHRSGNGARILQVISQLGIDWKVVRTWSGNKALERKLKNQHNAPKLCPVCQQLKKEKTQCLK
jgi:predicted GIY-YIG superfamily endonuclease